MEIALSLLGFAKDTIVWIVKFVQPKIDIKPKKIKINKSEWNKEGYFTVCNKTDTPLFDVQVLLWFRSNIASTPLLQVTKIDYQDNGKDLEIENIAINPVAFIVKGSANGKGIMLIQLQYLAPKECKRVFFYIDQQFEVDITLQAVSASTIPSQALKSTNKVAIPFTPPKNITVSSISFFMKKPK